MKKSKLLKSTQRTPSPVEDFVLKTEWTATAKIMQWINEIIKERQLPIGIAEVETKISKEKRRPDVVIYKGALDEEIICVLEFKPPYFEPDDEDNLKEPARKKATKLKSRYFAISNFQTLFLFNTVKVNEMKPLEEQIVGGYELSQIVDLNAIELPKFRNSICQGLEKFLIDIAQFISGEKTEPLIEINQLLVWRLQEKVNRLARYYKTIIEDEYHKNSEFRQQLRKWFNEQLWEFNAQDIDFVKAARQTAYLLVNKIMFYCALQAKRQRQLDPLNIPDDLTKGGLLKNHLQNYFDYVLQNIDYESIYDADFIDSLAFPEKEAVVDEIRNLVKILKHYKFSTLGFDIIGYIFEKLIPAEERHNLGQYFTHSNIVDLILGFCLKNEKDKVLDPACGAGTFLVRAYQYKKLMNLRLHHEDILEDLWGIDIAKFPAHLATINLAIRELSVDKNYPMIVNSDFFNLNAAPEGMKLPEKWRKVVTVALGKMGKETTYPRRFDCIVGNPPYTRHEEIPEIGVDKDRLIKNALFVNNQKLADISKRAGIHAYFFVHGTKFLKEGGYFGFIVSNSWLDVDYGKGLQEFFLKNYKIIAIIESKVERWFEDADINPCIVILQKCKNSEERDENFVHFVYIKKKLSELIPPVSENWAKQKERKDAIDALIKTILFHNDFYENEDLKIFPKKQKELWEERYDYDVQKYVGAKWGKYIRAPQIFFRILEKGKGKLVALKKIADVRRGYIPWPYEVFRISRDTVNKEKFLRQFTVETISSPTECNQIIISNEVLLPFHILIINKPFSEIHDADLRQYIKKVARKVERARKNAETWFMMAPRDPYPLVWPRTPYDRHIVFLNEKNVAVVDHVEIKPKEVDSKILCAILNSTIYALFRETLGRTGLGGGTLKTEVIDMNTFPVPQQSAITISPKKIIDLLHGIGQRRIESIFDELGASSPEEVSLDKVKPDRRELDKIIMGNILGLTEEEQLEVYREVIDLVKSRIEKAKSSDKRKKTKEGIDIELLIQNVLSHIGENNIGKFYKEKILTQPCYKKNLPDLEGKLEIEKDLFRWKLSGKNGFIDCDSELEAEYLKNFVGTGVTEVKIPRDKKYLKGILPELTELREKIDAVVDEEVLSILSAKTRNEVLHQLWQEIMKIEE
ncbi:MAG: HsdM family class I SAM-dependent methyltransferase [bacterium]